MIDDGEKVGRLMNKKKRRKKKEISFGDILEFIHHANRSTRLESLFNRVFSKHYFYLLRLNTPSYW